jgi:antitoxin MazE
MPSTQIVKWGNSLAVRIPKPVAEEAGMQEGDPIEIAAARGQIKVRRKDSIPSLKTLVSQINDENRYSERATGPARGKEAVEW